jgi:hypothetical protein
MVVTYEAINMHHDLRGTTIMPVNILFFIFEIGF